MSGSRGIGRALMLLGLAALVVGTGFPRRQARAEESGELSADDRAVLFAALAEEADALEARLNVVKTVVRLARPSVVHIEWQKRRAARPGGRAVQIEEAGSGVVLRLKEQFFVVTNWHVIRDAELKDIKIILADGRTLTPLQRWWDKATDVAVIAVEESGLVSAEVGDSDRLEIGDFVLAVGSPFGLSHSVTYGIISAKGRRDLELPNDDLRYQDFLQTDAAINPGNSGGPLFNLRGEVVGINTAIASSSGGNEGIGFTIPINMVMAITRQLVDRGHVVRAYLGVSLDPAFGPATAARLGLSRPHGALVNGVRPDSGASEAGIQVDDVILEFNHVRIDDDKHLVNVVSLTEVGQRIPVRILRQRQELTLEVRLGDRTQAETPAKPSNRTPAAPGSLDQSQLDEESLDDNSPDGSLPEGSEPESALGQTIEEEAWDVDALGLTLIELDDLRRSPRPAASQGLYVNRIDPRGPTAGKLRVGDVVAQLNGHPLVEIEDLERALSGVEVGSQIQLRVANRAGALRNVAVRLSAP